MGGTGGMDEDVFECPDELHADAVTTIELEHDFGVGPFALRAVGDIDSDGASEIMVDREAFFSQGDHVYELGELQFQCRDLRCAADANTVVPTDLDSDGAVDWLMSTLVYLGDGTGMFQAAEQVAESSLDVVVGDLNEDSIPDVVVLHNEPQACGNARVRREDAGEAPGCDSSQAARNGIHECPEGLRCFQSVDDSQVGFCHEPRCEYGTIHLGVGDGTFTEAGMFDLGFQWHIQNDTGIARLADIDGDGHLDLVYRTPFAQEIGTTVLRRGAGDGTLGEAVVLQEEGISPRDDIFATDVDDDGDLDLIMGRKVLLNDGAGSFPNEVSIPGQSFGSDQVLPGDLDGDGRMEVVLIGSRTDASTVMTVMHVQASGTETLYRFCDERRGNAADVADLDGDGSAEIIVGYQLSGMGIYSL
jgi:hypothetical protein